MVRVHEKVHAFSDAKYSRDYGSSTPGVRKYFKKMAHKEARVNAKQWMKVELEDIFSS